MGVSYNLARMMAIARRNDVQFTRTLTLGRLQWFVTPQQLNMLAGRYGLTIADHLFTPWPRYSEPWLTCLGAEAADAMDASRYEHANLIHDLNNPIDQALHGQYDVVIDGGTLEHVFNFPMAIANAMQLVKPGGTLFMVTPCNNLMGHGMIQVSPELIFSAFSTENGYELNDVILYVDPHHGGALAHLSPWYRVSAPAKAGRRVGAITCRPAYLLVRAERIKSVRPFMTWPQQVDYRMAWSTNASQPAANAAPPSRKSTIGRLLRASIRKVRALRNHLRSATSVESETITHQADLFEPIDP